MEDECCSTQLIDGEGEFNVAGLDHFMKTVKLKECGLSYAVVSIMGPQSSGNFLQHDRIALFSDYDLRIVKIKIVSLEKFG